MYADHGIPHDTTVIAIEENLITLSSAVSIPNETDVHFLRKGGSTVPFSFAIPTKATYVIKSDIDFEAAIFAPTRTRRIVDSAVVDGKVITLIGDGSRGVVAGMAIQGKNLVNSVGYDYLRVTSVDVAAGTVTVDANQNIDAGAKLTFLYPESISSSDSYSEYDGSHTMSLTHMQVSSSDGNLMVEGHFDINTLGKDSTNIDILIDNFITIT